MNMNRIAKVSAAVALGLGLLGASLAADAASARSTAARSQSGGVGYSSASSKVIHLNTILVTRADVAGIAEPKAQAAYGRTAYLGSIQVTASDSAEARAAAASVKPGTVFLGAVVVTAKDSEEARYAVAQAAAQPGTAFLGTVEVTARDTKPAFVGKTVVALRRIGRNAMVSMISALAFVRVGG
ncbi:MAG TPA: hypothetical protein VLV87_01185 [Gammaproteobacteria bacterium]|nr:hypothetical protein [Gammaproteobacteria bacterium]